MLSVGEENSIIRTSLFMTIQMSTILSILWTLLALPLLSHLVHKAFIILSTLSLYFKRKSPLQVFTTVIRKIYRMNVL